MSPLRSQEVRALLEAIDHLYTPVSASEFPQHLLRVIGDLVPNTLTTFDVVHSRPEACINVQNRPISAEWQLRCAELLPQHPSVVYVQGGGTERVLKISDFLSRRQFRQTQFYADIFRTAGIEHQIAVILPVPDCVAGFAINRDSDFTEDERLLLQYLRPHIVRAHALATAKAVGGGSEESLGDTLQQWIEKRGLTKREVEVLTWLAVGKRDKEIAVILGAQARTIQKHVANILLKLGVETRTAAAAEWNDRGRMP